MLLGVAAWLPPDQRGYGTHEALGLPPCSFVLNVGVPCPTCGMTTAFSYLVHGHPIESFSSQPAGFGLCIAVIAGCLVALRAAWTGVLVHPDWGTIRPVRTMVALGLLVVGSWGLKVAYGLWTGIYPVRH